MTKGAVTDKKNLQEQLQRTEKLGKQGDNFVQGQGPNQ